MCGHSFSRKSRLIQKSENALISQQKQKTISFFLSFFLSIVACQSRKRAIETSVESERRRQVDSACHVQKRLCETEPENQQRRQAQATRQSCKRALESQVESESRRQVDSACHAKRRALESVWDAVCFLEWKRWEVLSFGLGLV